MTRKQNVLFASGILLIIGLAVIIYGFFLWQEISGSQPVSVNRSLRERAYIDFAIGLVFVSVSFLFWFVYGRNR